MRTVWSREHGPQKGHRRPGDIVRTALIVGLLAVSSLAVELPATGTVESDGRVKPLVLCSGRPVEIVVDQKLISGWRKLYVGQVIKAHVGSDIEVDSKLVVRQGAPVELRLRHIRPGRLGHGRGQLLVEAVATRTVDRKRVVLQGGLYVEGRKHVVINYIPTSFTSIADLAFDALWASVVAPGGNAKIAKGMMFEVAVEGDHTIVLPAAREERGIR